MENISSKKMAVLGFLFISIFGTLSHFIFDWSQNNEIVGAFVAVNESVWEHLKIAIIPAFIWLMIYYFFKDNEKNLFTAKFLEMIVTMITIITIFYGYKAIFQNDNLIVDISSFYIAIALGQYVSYKVINCVKELMVFKNISFGLLALILLSFIIFTYFTPKLEIFRDPKDNTYGIQSLK